MTPRRVPPAPPPARQASLKMSAAPAKKAFTSFYRLAGMGYLDSLAVASTALRRVLKEPARSEALGRSNFKYREFTYADGKEAAPTEFSTTPIAKK